MSRRKYVIFFASMAVVLMCLMGVLAYQVWATYEEDTGEDRNYPKSENICSIDEEYEKKISLASSNIDICNLNYEFMLKWKDEISCYYGNILNSANESLHQSVINEQIVWEQYCQVSIEMQQHYLEQLYGSGTIVPVLLSQYEYELYRERAINLRDKWTVLEDTGRQ